MADVRCPMCSKPNPEDADVCIHCGARLKPLRPGSSELRPPEGVSEPLFGLPGAGEEEPDWLRALRTGDETGTTPEPPPSPAPAGDEAGVPDWLSRIREREQTEPGQSSPLWEPDAGAGQSRPGTGSLGTDWLDRLPGGTEESAAQPGDIFTEPAQPEETAASGDWSWLNELDSGEQPPAGRAGRHESYGVTGFLASLEPEEENPRSPAPAPEETTDSSLHGLGLTDFLNRAEEPPAQPPAQAQPSGTEGLPDWLKTGELGTGPIIPPYSDYGQPGRPGEALPDWLSGQPAAGTPVPLEPAAEEPIPNWLSDSEAEPRPAQPPAEQVAPLEPFQEPPLSTSETPDWLSSFQAETAASEPAAPLFSEEVPAAFPAGPGSTQPFSEIDLPDWLSEESTPGLDAPGEREELTSESLPQAELPAWVKEMRPIESVIPGAMVTETDQYMERSGPLAGMRGVLAAEGALDQVHKPPTYSARLRVTEKQHDQVALLEGILTSELQPLQVAPRTGRKARRLGRALLAASLLFILMIPRLLGMAPLGTPVLYPAEMLDMRNGIEGNLQRESTVLLAVDFEPALAGEMNLAAAPVVEHLMARGARVVVISTTPSGPALAEQLLRETARGYTDRGGQYNLADQMINLGYLPGGSMSLLEFAEYPQLAAPASLSGDPNVWQRTFLQSIAGVQDFAQVIVLTDSAETGRTWVEQLQPRLGSVPLCLVASAQAAPLMMPYLESRQVRGMVSGALGGAMYAQYNAGAGSIPPPPQESFVTYQVASLLGLLLIITAGVVSALRGLAQRRGKEEA